MTIPTLRPMDWLVSQALPFWSQNGFDEPGLGVWEGLDHDGRPLPKLTKRMRVQARQTLVFAAASAAGLGNYIDHAKSAFSFMGRCAFDPATGTFQALLDREGSVTDGTQDLYDLAFVLLALAHLKAAGEDGIVGEWLPRWHHAVGLHKTHRGWKETPDGRLPRRQNPHMHMFEATLSYYETTGDRAFLMMADECLNLLRDVFLDRSSGLLLEHFDEDWRPVAPSRQVVEPGHMVEWVFLLSEYERVTGLPSQVDLRRLFDRALSFGLDTERKFLLDQLSLNGTTIAPSRRLWPQTELLRAAITLSSSGEVLPASFSPHAILERLQSSYLDTPVPGGWFDQFDATGRLTSTYMPSSSFYHLYSSFTAFDR